MRNFFSSLVAIALALSGLACAAKTETGPAGSSAVGGKADGASAIELGLDDDGSTIQVPEGYAVVVRLPANPSTGYGWKVVSTDRTFGYPEEDFEADESGRPGAGGVAVLTWQTGGFVRAGGSHTVGLAYARGDDDPADTFTFTVEVVEAAAPEGPAGVVELTAENNGETVEVPEGFDLVVKLRANPSSGYRWKVASTSRTFGYPEVGFVIDEAGPVGAGGTTVLTWHTGGFVRAGGQHTVTLEYRRPGDPDAAAADTFRFTVEIVEP